MNSLFWGLHTHGDQLRKEIQTGMEARQVASQAREAQSAVLDLERRLSKLTLISMALWSLLSEKVRLTEEDLMERVKTIDLMDGEADGKLKREVAKCGNCGRVMSPRHPRCLYCGADRLHITAFDEVI